jgi:RimJ/RimL family protein N-acetyltransferase
MTDLALDIPEPRALKDLPPLIGRRVTLRAVNPSDYDVLYRWALHPANILQWRYRGKTPPPEEFAPMMWRGVLTEFMVTNTRTGEPVAMVQAYDPETRGNTIHFALLIAPEHQSKGWVIDGAIMFLAYLFETWPLRKVYLEMVEFNFERVRSGIGHWFEVEGCLKDHDWHDGRYWHFYFLAMYREAFLSLWRDRYRAHLLGSPDAAALD